MRNRTYGGVRGQVNTKRGEHLRLVFTSYSIVIEPSLMPYCSYSLPRMMSMNLVTSATVTLLQLRNKLMLFQLLFLFEGFKVSWGEGVDVRSLADNIFLSHADIDVGTLGKEFGSLGSITNDE